MLGPVHPARRWRVFLSAAIAAVLAVALPAVNASAATRSAAGNRVGASHSQTIPAVGVSHPVLPGQGRCGGLTQAQVAAGARVAAEDTVPLYHGTTPENAASIRANGIDLARANPRTDFGPGFYTTRSYEQALARAGGDPAGVLTYNVPQSMFENLSGITFEDGGSDYAAFLRSIRSGGMHSYDYVEGPVLRNPGTFYSGKDPVTFGNQISFNTQTAIDIMNGYLR